MERTMMKMEKEKNFKEIIAEQYERGELPVLGRKDTFEFACIQCGECCRNREDILLNPFDIFRLCKAKEMTVVEFFKKYCELYTGESSKLPLAIIKFRPVYEFGSDRVIGTRCPFLGQKDGLHFCRVHKDKPFVCFSYPLGRVQKCKAKPEYILQTDGTCKGAMKAKEEGIHQVVEDWMFGKERLDIEERYNEIFSCFLGNYHGWINVKKLAESRKALPIYQKWLATVGELLYVNYDFTADENTFLDQLQANIGAIEAFCKLVVSEFSEVLDLRPEKK